MWSKQHQRLLQGLQGTFTASCGVVVAARQVTQVESEGSNPPPVIFRQRIEQVLVTLQVQVDRVGASRLSEPPVRVFQRLLLDIVGMHDATRTYLPGKKKRVVPVARCGIDSDITRLQVSDE